MSILISIITRAESILTLLVILKVATLSRCSDGVPSMELTIGSALTHGVLYGERQATSESLMVNAVLILQFTLVRQQQLQSLSKNF